VFHQQFFWCTLLPLIGCRRRCTLPSSSSKTNSRQLRFGLFEVDLDRGTLTRQGTAVKLQEQPFRILALLLEAQGEILSREDIRKRIWPEGTFVEFDGSLNTALMKLRAALNDNAENPIFIETVPRKGYRFIAPIVPVLVDAPTVTTAVRITSEGQPVEDFEVSASRITAPPSALRQLSSHSKGVYLSWWQAGAILLGLFGIVLYSLWPKTQPRVSAVRQLTHSGQVDPWGRLVTDGSRIYFVIRDVSGWNLMQTSVEGGSSQKTPTPFDNTRIFDLSPDHSQFLIGQLTHRGEATPLWLWPVQGGAPRRVGDVMAEEAVLSPKGDQIAFLDGESIKISTTEGEAVREIARFHPAPHSLVWSPDAKRLRFTQMEPSQGTDSMWEIATDGSSLRRVLPEGQRGPHEGSGTWLAGGKYFAFSSGVDLRASLAVDARASLWLMEEQAGLFSRTRGPVQLTTGPIAFDHPVALPTEGRVFVIGSQTEYQLLRIDPKNSARTAMLTESGATGLDFSLDGQYVVYAARESGTLWKSRLDGTGKLELTAQATGAFAPMWSPDEKQILFTGFLLDKQPRLYVVSSKGGTPKPVLPTNNKWASVSGGWKTDGSQIVMDVLDTETSGETNIRLWDLATSTLTELAGSQGLIEPRWSSDGRYIAALHPKKKQVWLYDCQSKKWSVLADANFPSALRWAPGGDALYFQDVDELEQSVFRVSMATKEVERVTGFGDLLSFGASRCIFTGLSPDGSVYVTVDHGGVDVYSVDLQLP
jgi:DNA-binding winged helix-turn-helix (wHTH) protein/Tol biopolymer transport system component